MASTLRVGALACFDDTGSSKPLIELLRLHGEGLSDRLEPLIAAIASVRATRSVARIDDQLPVAVARGIDLDLRFATNGPPRETLFVFANVLARFLASQCSINSFVRLRGGFEGREEDLWRWPARSGDRILG